MLEKSCRAVGHLSTTGRFKKCYLAVIEWRTINGPGYRYYHSEEYLYKKNSSGLSNHQSSGRRPRDESWPSAVPFPYEPFESAGHIRVLELEAGEGLEPLTGRLVPMDLRTAQEFEAVSYVWGQQHHGTYLTCDGRQISITTPVAEMLRRFRLPDRPRRLWIDAICINQRDVLERNSQVGLMGDIYRSAARVLIWLGEEDAQTVDAFKIFEDAYLAIDKAITRYGSYPTLLNLLESELPAPDDKRWIAFGALMYRPWFTRTWILQEVSLARVASVHCGQYWCYWSHLALLLRAFHYTAALRAIDVDLYWSSTVASIAAQTEPQQHIKPSLLRLLAATIDTGATNPRDKVYALLGIAGDGAAFRSGIDYDKSVADVFREVAIRYLDAPNDNLLALHLASDPAWRSERSLPSWAPDFHIGATRAMTLLGMSCAKFSPPCECEAPNVSNNGMLLNIKGVVKTRITGTGRRLPVRAPGTHAVDALFFLEQWRTMAKRLRHYPTNEPIDEAFSRTLIVNQQTLLSKSEQQTPQTYHMYFQQFRDSYLAGEWQPDNLYAKTLLYHHYLQNACRRRTFFVTQDGHMGLGPYFARRDDLVVRFHGAGTPFIIRKRKGGWYRLVGEAYVHGMMEPEPCWSDSWQLLSLV